MSNQDWDIDTSNMDFLSDENTEKKTTYRSKGHYTILISDDEPEVHQVTKLLLNDFTFEGKSLEFVDAYSAEESKKILAENDEIAVAFLDVVMEDSHSGLEVVEFIRKELKNPYIRIILRTGQPGEAPEREVIRSYDINDYRIKTELTAKRLYTSLYTAMRSYRDLRLLERHQRGLEKIIKASSNLFRNNSLDDFLITVLEELGSFQSEDADIIFLRDGERQEQDGLVTMQESGESRIVAATGRYAQFTGWDLKDVKELKSLREFLESCRDESNNEMVHKIDNGFLVCTKSKNLSCNYIYIQGDPETFDFDLINLFLTHFSVSLDNFILNNMLNDTQADFIYALGDMVETHYPETGHHTQRVSDMMYRFALVNNFSYQEARMLKLASSMHDIGKVSVPKDILEKPGPLTNSEFDTAKEHTVTGHRILAKSKLPVLKTAAEIALYHHERFDGNGYPEKVSGRDIPLSSRMMSIVDVFDALTHDRCYEEAICEDDAVQSIIDGKGAQFDPVLVDIFVANLDKILGNDPIDGDNPVSG